jgi:hypothetical protein
LLSKVAFNPLANPNTFITESPKFPGINFITP